MSGDFRADGVDDILWYLPGTGNDILWDNNPGGGKTDIIYAVNASNWEPIAFDPLNDGVDDVLWYAPTSGNDVLWDNNADGSKTDVFYTESTDLDHTAGDYFGDSHDDIYWSSATCTKIWDWTAGGGTTQTVWPLGCGSFTRQGHFDAESIEIDGLNV